jgi:hypothetical protein
MILEINSKQEKFTIIKLTFSPTLFSEDSKEINITFEKAYTICKSIERKIRTYIHVPTEL